MATQASSAAGSAASAGVASSAAAGAAAGAAATAAAGAAAGQIGIAAAVASSVPAVTAVAETTVVAAAVAGVATVTITSNNTDPQNASTVGPALATAICQPEQPVFRDGTFTMFLEGFARPFTDRETKVVENLVVEAYNDVTYSEDVGRCIDRYQRNMLNTTLVNQVFTPLTDNNISMLETTFSAWVACTGCPREEPLFGGGGENDDRRELQVELGLDSEFFRRFIERVDIEIMELIEVNELAPGYVEISIAYVEDTNDETTETFVLNPEEDLVVLAEFLPPTEPSSPKNPVNPVNP